MINIYREQNSDSRRPAWVLLDAPMDHKWTETIETIIGIGRMNLHSGEGLYVSRNMQLIFETSSIEKVSS